MKKTILLITHGSRARDAKKEIVGLSRIIKKKTQADELVYCFLDVNQPDIASGVKKCVKKGANEIIVLLNFLNSGNHVRDDIPKILKKTKKQFPQLRFFITPPIGQHPKIPALFLENFNHQNKAQII